RPTARHGGDNLRCGIDAADAVVAVVSDKDVAGAVHGNTIGLIQAGARGGASVTAEARSAVARYGGDVARRGVHAADAVVPPVGDEEVAGAVYGHAVDTIEAGVGGGAAVAAKAVRPIARHGGDGACRGIHAADAAVVSVGDEEVAGAVHGHTRGVPQAGAGGGAAVAAEGLSSVPRHGADGPGGGVHATDAAVVSVGDEEVAGSVRNDTGRRDEQSARGRAAIPVASAPCHRANLAGSGIHTADTVVVSVADQKVAGAVHGHTIGLIQAGARGEASVTAEARSAVARHGGDGSGGRIHPPDAL